mmetsp:Transcript_61989/g.146890  ORF Transcript_61989/g.146890 Transcript_61989/m.146890 type:complete len:238 (+) Transcript_61989:707-1420(+)
MRGSKPLLGTGGPRAAEIGRGAGGEDSPDVRGCDAAARRRGVPRLGGGGHTGVAAHAVGDARGAECIPRDRDRGTGHGTGGAVWGSRRDVPPARGAPRSHAGGNLARVRRCRAAELPHKSTRPLRHKSSRPLRHKSTRPLRRPGEYRHKSTRPLYRARLPPLSDRARARDPPRALPVHRGHPPRPLDIPRPPREIESGGFVHFRGDVGGPRGTASCRCSVRVGGGGSGERVACPGAS